MTTALILLVSIGGKLFVRAAETSPVNDSTAWSAPTRMAMRRMGALGTVQNQPNLLSNLDCTAMTYRSVSGSTMQNGCFTPTAFGMFDVDNQTVIFNGTDEGLRISAYGPGELLAPWPTALNLITLDSASTGGDYIGIYKNPLAVLQDKRDFAGRLTGKQLTAPRDISLKDPSGKPLIVNDQTMAFSSGGSWLVVETLGGSFVRINLATLDVTAFAQSFGSQGSPALLKSQVAVSDDGRFVAIANTVASSFEIYDLNTCNGVVNNLQPQNCKAHDYWPFVSQQVHGLQSLRHIRFINDGLLSFDAISNNAALSGTYELAPMDSITSLTDYIGLGDSYTSGEGAFGYLEGTDTANSKCHVSSQSYPLLLTRDLFRAAGGHSVACSGAVINDIGSSSPSYRGQVNHGASFEELSRQPEALANIQANFSVGYIAQHRFVRQYQPRVVTVSIGGNDIGFGDLLQRCVVPHVSRHTSDETCYNTYESREEVARLVDRTVPRWTALYKQLQAEDPNGHIYAIGYPSIASDLGSCGLNVNLNKSELEFAEELIAYLNGSIRQAAGTASVPYIDISQALVGHRLCEAAGYDAAVNGLTAGNDNGFLGINVLGRESYHPNALGHQLIEQAILRQSDNLTAGLATTQPASNDNHNLLDAPRSGAAINTLVPAKMVNPVVPAGKDAPIQVDGILGGLKPGVTYAIRLDGPSGSQVASIMSDASGNVAGSITIPAGTALGDHTVDIVGTNQAGEPVDMRQPVYITGNSDDSDTDGVVDNNDSCPYAVNSGQDSDNDGVDDICDGQLIHMPANTDPSGPAGQSPPDMDLTSAAAESPQNNPLASEQAAIFTVLQPASRHVDTAGVALSKTSTGPSVILPAATARPEVKGIVLAATRQSNNHRPARSKQTARYGGALATPKSILKMLSPRYSPSSFLIAGCTLLVLGAPCVIFAFKRIRRREHN